MNSIADVGVIPMLDQTSVVADANSTVWNFFGLRRDINGKAISQCKLTKLCIFALLFAITDYLQLHTCVKNDTSLK